MSPSSRRAWIEINHLYKSGKKGGVALLAEGVDRNRFTQSRTNWQEVALLAEGVDRNENWMATAGEQEWVALLAEGVDRNYFDQTWTRAMPSRPPRGGRG